MPLAPGGFYRHSGCITNEDTSTSEKRPLLDWFLAGHPDTPKTRAKQFIAAGRVSVHGEIIRKPHQVIPNPGKDLQLLSRHSVSIDCGQGWRIHPRVTLLYLDSAMAVINKGSGLISVPDQEHLSALGILQDFISGKLKSRSPECAGATFPPEFRHLTPEPVHRLDQYTSGLFCLAFKAESRARLIEQLRRGEIKREYVAFAEGRPVANSGTWRTWLELDDEDGRQQIISEPAKQGHGAKQAEAITHFEVLARYTIGPHQAPYTKLRLRLETGLKHQIRIQASQAGLPLVGDRTYNPNYRPGVAPLLPMDRQALHADFLELWHPHNARQKLSWRGELPDDMRQLEGRLNRGKQ